MSESTWGITGEVWQGVPPPMVPAPEDLALVRALSADALEGVESPRILVLGVTPALVAADWPAGSEIHAVDYDPVMIETQWHARPNAEVHLAHWQAMPLPDAQFDLVIGDCSLNALPSFGDYADVLREIARVSRPGAPLVTRCFLQAEPPLTPARLVALAQRELTGIRASAMRLLIVMAAARPDGTMLMSEVPKRIAEDFGDVDAFLDALGEEGEGRMRAKRLFKLDQQLNYPNEAQMRALLAPFFSEVTFTLPPYDVGRFCPILHCR